MTKAGILLSGCGMFDGTEIAEAVLAALALERAGARVIWLAPEAAQMHTVDHLSGSEVEGESRGMLAEAARLARGKVKALAEQWPGELGALVIPGGHGAVKNLMTNFAVLGAPRELIAPVRDLLSDLTGRAAPIGSISLGRAVVCAFFNEPLSGDEMQMPAGEIQVDEGRRVVFTPGFLTGGSLPDVATGIDRMVRALLNLPARELHVIH
jgi:enhancing lycopene biosynthesis protein 2